MTFSDISYIDLILCVVFSPIVLILLKTFSISHWHFNKYSTCFHVTKHQFVTCMYRKFQMVVILP